MSYSCVGRLLDRREIETVLVDAFYREQLDEFFEHRCPEGHTDFGVTCPSDRARLHLEGRQGGG